MTKGSADEIWRQIEEHALAEGANAESAAAQFRELYGFSDREASEGELRAHLDWLRNPPEPRPEPELVVIYPAPAPTVLEDGHVRVGHADDWVAVRGATLPQPLDVRIGMVNGRARVIGLRVDNGQEITARTLRQIKLAPIVETFLGGHTPNGPDLEQASALHHQDLWEEWAGFSAYLDSLPVIDPESATSRRGVAPDEQSLQRFARVYLEHMQKRPRGAMSAAARAIPIARSTAYRWAAQCRERGFLPPEEDESS